MKYRGVKLNISKDDKTGRKTFNIPFEAVLENPYSSNLMCNIEIISSRGSFDILNSHELILGEKVVSYLLPNTKRKNPFQIIYKKVFPGVKIGP